ncbi:hypothetical protein SAMN04487787_104332 [Kosakonia sacchari]|nr:hypothetical protein SAMN04487787_104332 [Kosakonia sacchari]
MCLKCQGTTKNKKIVLSEKGTATQLTVNNEEALETTHKLIDGCVIVNGERCDHYLKILNGDKISHLFVELKGSDVEKAARQITTTIKSGCTPIDKNEQKYAAIVSTRNPLSSTETAKIKKKMLKEEKVFLHFYKMKAQEKISKFS